MDDSLRGFRFPASPQLFTTPSLKDLGTLEVREGIQID